MKNYYLFKMCMLLLLLQDTYAQAGPPTRLDTLKARQASLVVMIDTALFLNDAQKAKLNEAFQKEKFDKEPKDKKLANLPFSQYQFKVAHEILDQSQLMFFFFKLVEPKAKAITKEKLDIIQRLNGQVGFDGNQTIYFYYLTREMAKYRYVFDPEKLKQNLAMLDAERPHVLSLTDGDSYFFLRSAGNDAKNKPNPKRFTGKGEYEW